jgi:hypothetical protein
MMNTLYPEITQVIPGIVEVNKYTHNEAGNSNIGSETSDEGATATVTADRLFLLSAVEAWGESVADADAKHYFGTYFFLKEGTQYEYYLENGVTVDSYTLLASTGGWNWMRSPSENSSKSFHAISLLGLRTNATLSLANLTGMVVPCFCL